MRGGTGPRRGWGPRAGSGAALLAAVLGAGPDPAGAQLQAFFSPELGRLMGRAEYRITHYPDQPVAGQGTGLGMTEHRGSFFTPLVQGPTDELALGGRVRLQEFATGAVLPDSGLAFPGELWEIRVEPAYRHRFASGWIAGAVAALGSASDRPFASADELVIRATGFLRVPHGERHAWVVMLNYSNAAELLEGLPVPGLAYLYQPSERLRAVIGLPVAAIEVRPLEPLSLEASYQALRTVRARATYRIFRPLRVWAGFDWDNEFHLLADRRDADDRLYYYEKRLGGGARFDLRQVGVEVAGGWAFDRFYFQGDGYSDRHDDRLDVDDGPFLAARLNLRF